MSVSGMTDDLSRSRRVLEDIAGEPVRLFRPLFGVVNLTVAKAVRRLGLRTIGWSIRTFDTSLLGKEVGMDLLLFNIVCYF